MRYCGSEVCSSDLAGPCSPASTTCSIGNAGCAATPSSTASFPACPGPSTSADPSNSDGRIPTAYQRTDHRMKISSFLEAAGFAWRRAGLAMLGGAALLAPIPDAQAHGTRLTAPAVRRAGAEAPPTIYFAASHESLLSSPRAAQDT